MDGFSELFWPWILLIGLSSWIAFVVHALVGALSEKTAKDWSNHRRAHYLWFTFNAIFVWVAWYAYHGPPWQIRVRETRSTVLHRVEFSGGWQNLVKDCNSLVTQTNHAGYPYWNGRDPALPSTLSRLRSRFVRVEGTGLTTNIAIQFSGGHSTGGPCSPSYWLIVIGSANEGAPAIQEGKRGTTRKITDSVFERIAPPCH
jgi:hypothetical protein